MNKKAVLEMQQDIEQQIAYARTLARELGIIEMVRKILTEDEEAEGEGDVRQKYRDGRLELQATFAGTRATVVKYEGEVVFHARAHHIDTFRYHPRWINALELVYEEIATRAEKREIAELRDKLLEMKSNFEPLDGATIPDGYPREKEAL